MNSEYGDVLINSGLIEKCGNGIRIKWCSGWVIDSVDLIRFWNLIYRVCKLYVMSCYGIIFKYDCIL